MSELKARIYKDLKGEYRYIVRGPNGQHIESRPFQRFVECEREALKITDPEWMAKEE